MLDFIGAFLVLLCVSQLHHYRPKKKFSDPFYWIELSIIWFLLFLILWSIFD